MSEISTIPKHKKYGSKSDVSSVKSRLKTTIYTYKKLRRFEVGCYYGYVVSNNATT